MNFPKYILSFRKIMELKNYSENTISNYTFQVERFLKDAKEFTEPTKINEKFIIDYLLQFKSHNTNKHAQCALRLFFKTVVHQPKKFKYIPYPKKQKALPKIIDAKYLKEKINTIDNLKHKSIISLGFGCAMRVSEVINLKVTDVDSKRMIIHIHNAKGRKDRIVRLSQNLLDLLREYFKEYKPSEYLFEGQFKSQYSSSSCNAIVKKYLGQKYHFHLLRHSGLTDMHEHNVDIATLSKIAGHNSIKTTMIYTHVSNNVIQNSYSPI